MTMLTLLKFSWINQLFHPKIINLLNCENQLPKYKKIRIKKH